MSDVTGIATRPDAAGNRTTVVMKKQWDSEVDLHGRKAGLRGRLQRRGRLPVRLKATRGLRRTVHRTIGPSDS